MPRCGGRGGISVWVPRAGDVLQVERSAPWGGAREVKAKYGCFQSLRIPYGLCVGFIRLLLGFQAFQASAETYTVPSLQGDMPDGLVLGTFFQDD